MSEWIRFGLSALSMLCGMVVIGLSIFGVFRFRFVLNRMHYAAIIDTLGTLFILISLMLAAEAPVYVWKLLLVLVFLWIGSPISSHLVSRLEVTTDKTAPEHMKILQEEEEKK